MYYICCIPICPSFLSNVDVYSSDKNIYQKPNFMLQEKFHLYVSRFDRYFHFSDNEKNYNKDFDEEFDLISLSDNENNSHEKFSDQVSKLRQNSVLNADGSPNTRRLLPGITNINNNSNNNIDNNG
ncbi:unnamed protein product, partial [Rotaria sp. Silwood1]